MTVGERIQQCRKIHNLSQEELGKRLFVSRQTISQWETDQTLPTIDNLMRLKEVFGISIDTLLCGDSASEAPVKTPRRTRKKVWIILLSILVGAALLIGLLINLCKLFLPQLYYRCYLGDRVTGTVSVTVDGEVYPLKSGSISSADSYLLKKARVNYQLNGSARIRIRGGDKASYGFLLYIDGVEQPIRIGTFHYNWWAVTQFDLTASVDTSTDTVTFRCTAKVIDNDGEWIPVEDSATVPLSDPEICFGFGLS